MIYHEFCGKNILDDADSKIKFQILELLKITVDVLKKESELVRKKINQQSDINRSKKLIKLNQK